MQRSPYFLAGALIFLGSAASAFGLRPDEWVPVRWPGGPLEAARRAPADPEMAAVLKNWYQPVLLELLRDTPINCLVVTWSAAADPAVVRDQQRTVAEYAKEAQKRGVAVLGLIYSGGDPVQAASAAFHFELDGLVLEADFARADRLAASVRELTLKTGRNIAVIALPAGAGPPGIRLLSDSGAATATPTSEPWIESNISLVRSLRAGGTTPVWLGCALDHPGADDYMRAIAESWAAGGRWAVAPDDALIAGLSHKRSDALATWRRIGESLAFFEQHSDWRRYVPAGPLGIVQDPAGKHADMAAENLNLVGRRRIPYRIIQRSELSTAALEGLEAVLALDLSPLAEKERTLLQAFAVRGGLVVTGPAWGVPVPARKQYLEQVTGKGRIIAYREAVPDPEALSKDLFFFLEDGNLGVRLFNVPTILPQVSASDDRRQLLVQMINYATGPAEAITVRVSGRYRAARLYRPNDAAADLTVETSGQSTEVSIPRMQVYAALLLEK